MITNHVYALTVGGRLGILSYETSKQELPSPLLCTNYLLGHFHGFIKFFTIYQLYALACRGIKSFLFYKRNKQTKNIIPFMEFFFNVTLFNFALKISKTFSLVK